MNYELLELAPETTATIITTVPGAVGRLPVTEPFLLEAASGDFFGGVQTAAMLQRPPRSFSKDYLILSTLGGIRDDNGKAVAAGYHTGHFELGDLGRAAAEVFNALGVEPFAGYVSDPCDGRTNGTSGMFDSLPYRNDAAMVFRRLIRSLPRRNGVLGIATCDKGAPAMMMALASLGDLPGIFVPGGVTLATQGPSNTAEIQATPARFAHHEVTLDWAAVEGCRTCASPGGGCQFLGTAASMQVIGEALGLSLPHSALAPSGLPIWREVAKASAAQLVSLREQGIGMRDILSWEAAENAIAVHLAFGCSTNLLLHIPAILYHAGIRIPTVADWARLNAKVKRIVSVLPNGPVNHPTVRAYLAGGVPEVMLHLREMGLLHLDVMTVTGKTLGDNLSWWEQSRRRQELKARLQQTDGVDAADVIMSPDKAEQAGLTATLVFPTGNICPDGSVIKATAIDSKLCPGNVFSGRFRARVFVTEDDAIRAIKSTGDDRINPCEIVVLTCLGPTAACMPETFQCTSALKYTRALSGTPLITDGRFSGVSTGPCIGHVGPEAIDGGPIGKLLDGDLIEVIIDRSTLTGSLNLVGDTSTEIGNGSIAIGDALFASRESRSDLAPQPGLPEDGEYFGALQSGTWTGAVYDTRKIKRALRPGWREE